MKKVKKKGLTLPRDSDRIAKLSQREGSGKSAESRPKEGKELAQGSDRSVASEKNNLKKLKKALDKLNSM